MCYYYCYMPEANQQSRQWVQESRKVPKKDNTFALVGKVMVSVVWINRCSAQDY